MIKLKSYNIQIWVGLREGYSDVVHPIDDVRDICDKYIALRGGDCVTITPTEFRYKDGSEQGVIVGFIQYPRFPCPVDELTEKAIVLAKMLKEGLNQIRVTITTPDHSFMLE